MKKILIMFCVCWASLLFADKEESADRKPPLEVARVINGIDLEEIISKSIEILGQIELRDEKNLGFLLDFLVDAFFENPKILEDTEEFLGLLKEFLTAFELRANSEEKSESQDGDTFQTSNPTTSAAKKVVKESILRGIEILTQLEFEDEEDLELFLDLFFEDFCEKPENFKDPEMFFERLEEFVNSFNLLSASKTPERSR